MAYINFIVSFLLYKNKEEGVIINLKIMYVKYPNIKVGNECAHKIRGYFGSKFIENIELHNHLNEKFVYSYPKIQYKMLKNVPLIIAIDDCIPILHNAVMKTDEIIVDKTKYSAEKLNIKLDTKILNISNKMNKYVFLSPWFCLNQINYKKYIELDKNDRKLFLDKILIGNILSMCKGLNFCVDDKIIVDTNLKETSINFKKNSMVNFYGTFYVNFNIPNYFGLGKSVSRGFGMIKQLEG